MTHFSLFTEKPMAACARKRHCVFSLTGSRPITFSCICINFAVQARKRSCVFSLTGSRPITFSCICMNFAVQARKRPCVFSLTGSRPITQERTSFLPASRRNVVLSCVALLVAYAHYIMFHTWLSPTQAPLSL